MYNRVVKLEMLSDKAFTADIGKFRVRKSHRNFNKS